MVLIIGTLIQAYLEDRESRRRYICDGCGKTIDGKFIRITEPELSQPLDYCTEKCKKKNVSMGRIKFAKPRN